jgi:hypothetical protein
MGLQTIKVPIVRTSETSTPTLGTATAEAAIAGSPFAARVYRVNQAVTRDEAAPGVATVNQQRRLSIVNPSVGVRIGDVALIPSDDNPGTTERAKVLNVRRYDDRIQCDLETGVEG